MFSFLKDMQLFFSNFVVHLAVHPLSKRNLRVHPSDSFFWVAVTLHFFLEVKKKSKNEDPLILGFWLKWNNVVILYIKVKVFFPLRMQSFRVKPITSHWSPTPIIYLTIKYCIRFPNILLVTIMLFLDKN